MEPVWFAGVHSNIGGGSSDIGLSDVTLKWMKGKAEACGLSFDEGALPAFSDKEYLGRLGNSKTGIYRLLLDYIRPIGQQPSGNETVAPSALARMNEVGLQYRPVNLIEYLDRQH